MICHIIIRYIFQYTKLVIHGTINEPPPDFLETDALARDIARLAELLLELENPFLELILK